MFPKKVKGVLLSEKVYGQLKNWSSGIQEGNLSRMILPAQTVGRKGDPRLALLRSIPLHLLNVDVHLL